MRRLVMFNNISLDGYFTDVHGDMSWARTDWDAEWAEFAFGNARDGGLLLFGRVTYDLMAGYWPTPAAKQGEPELAKCMNALPKVVFSRKISRADWNNTTLIKDDPVEAVRRLKRESGPGMAVLGSGRIVAQLAAAGLIDEYQFAVIPMALGAGRTLFEGLPRPLHLKLKSLRAFRNGNVVLSYERGPNYRGRLQAITPQR